MYCLTGTAAEFYSYTVLMLLTVPAAALLPLYLRRRERHRAPLLAALKRCSWCMETMHVTVALVGAVNSAVSDFLLWQMEDHDATELHMGAALALANVCQAGFVPLAGRLARLLRYHGWLLVLAVVSLSLQCLYYSFLWGPWTVIPAQLLAGFSVGALWRSVESQCEDIATPGTEKTLLRLFEGLWLELGAGVGSLTAGLVVQKFGLRVLFQGAAVILVLWGLVLALLKWRFPQQHRINYSRLLAAGASGSSGSDSEQENDWLETVMDDSRQKNKL